MGRGYDRRYEVQGADGQDLRPQVALLGRRVHLLAECVRPVRVHAMTSLPRYVTVVCVFCRMRLHVPMIAEPDESGNLVIRPEIAHLCRVVSRDE